MQNDAFVVSSNSCRTKRCTWSSHRQRRLFATSTINEWIKRYPRRPDNKETCYRVQFNCLHSYMLTSRKCSVLFAMLMKKKSTRQDTNIETPARVIKKFALMFDCSTMLWRVLHVIILLVSGCPGLFHSRSVCHICFIIIYNKTSFSCWSLWPDVARIWRLLDIGYFVLDKLKWISVKFGFNCVEFRCVISTSFNLLGTVSLVKVHYPRLNNVNVEVPSPIPSIELFIVIIDPLFAKSPVLVLLFCRPGLRHFLSTRSLHN